jgi:hypothetical protein
VAWCATFVSWCANESGYIDAGIIPKFAACESQGIVWFTERGLYQDSSYIPAPGDIIFITIRAINQQLNDSDEEKMNGL